MENTKIKLKKEEKEYILEYNRQSIQQLERMGFSLEDMTKKPATMFPIMFRGAFLANHKTVKESEINDLYEQMTKKDVLHSKLIEMISETYLSLVEDNDTQGNVDWEIV